MEDLKGGGVTGVGGQVLQGSLLPGMDPGARVDIKPGVLPAPHHSDHFPGDPAPGQEHPEDLVIVGCVTTRQVKAVPKEERTAKRVGDVMISCSPDNTIEPEADAMKALSLMHRSGGSRLIVADHGNLAGVITLKDLTKFLSLKIELEEH